jgi:hypothetical protein
VFNPARQHVYNGDDTQRQSRCYIAGSNTPLCRALNATIGSGPRASPGVGIAKVPCWFITASLRYLPVTESSVTLPPEPKAIILRPLCPACQTRTMFARVTPGPVGFDIRTFECPTCNHVHQTVVELPIDPKKSIRTNGWLRGQLQAPT